ncbi:hypothetical protein [Dokdonella sp.]|uniref:hypothetical protein n=1 Tax=Dokdonella sp. TaxID=2291710 RepID=UPI003526FBFB
MLLIVLLAGCAPPPPVMPADLAYPVLVLFPQSGSVRHDDAADLKIMSVQRVMGAHGEVYLIDSRLDIYRLDKLESEHSGIWLMAHPNGRTEVRFDLQRIATADAIRARQLIVDRDARMKSADGATLRTTMLEATSMKDMLQIIGK